MPFQKGNKLGRGRPLGSGRPNFNEYISEQERTDFIKWVKENYQTKLELARWMGDQIFGKAPQTMDITSAGKPLPLFDYVQSRKNNSDGENKDSEEKD